MARIRLDHGGIAAILKSAEVAKEIRRTAGAVAARVEADPDVQRHSAPVDVTEYVTDRAAAAVTITHAAGRGLNAKYGSLFRAAGDEGLDVTERAE